MDKQKLTTWIIAGLLALVVLCILIVGIFEGIWPWDGPKAYAKIFREDPPAAAPAETEPQAPEGEEEEAPIGDVPGSQGTNIPTRNPVIEGESTTGGNNVQEEVELPENTGNSGNTGNTGSNEGNTGSSEGNTGSNEGNTENSGSDTSNAPDANTTVSGNKIPGWGN